MRRKKVVELEKEIEQLKRDIQLLNRLVFAVSERITKLENKDKIEYFK